MGHCKTNCNVMEQIPSTRQRKNALTMEKNQKVKNESCFSQLEIHIGGAEAAAVTVQIGNIRNMNA